MDTSNVISVFGASNPEPDSAEYALARAVGRVLAELGYIVANGGYGGTMEASSRGAKEAGGHTIGVMCNVWASRPNEFIDEVIETSDYTKRLTTLIDLGRAGYVVLPGATGTLVELAWVWEHACKGWWTRSIAMVGKFWKPLLKMMVAQRARSVQYVRLISTAAELREVFPRFPKR
ncbi:MAG: LOG family protein [Phycisphaerae bacterium]|nr:LOG family protein [Phycisphaerae bacterium]